MDIKYFNYLGTSAGPIQILNLEDKSKETWLISNDNSLFLGKSKSYECTFYAKLQNNGTYKYDKTSNELATKGWVATYYSAGNTPIDASDFVSSITFEEYRNKLDSLISMIETLNIEELGQRVQILENKVNNPFSEGVVFVAGGAL